MPYIEQDRREAIKASGGYLNLNSLRTPGELNYALSEVAKAYLKGKPVRYDSMAEVVAAFDNAKDEFRRRVLHPYENSKIEQNGDIYGSD